MHAIAQIARGRDAVVHRVLLLILALSIITASPAAHEPRPYKQRGFGRIGARCPECGAPISHGLPGNPHARKIPPCRTALTTTTTLPFARDGPRDAARRAARRKKRKSPEGP